MIELSIAGLPVHIESADTAFFEERFAAYKADTGRPPIMRMRTTLVDPVPLPEGEVIQRVQYMEIRRLPDGRVCRCGRHPDGHGLFNICCTPDYADVEIELLSTRQHPQLTQTDWEYLFTGYCFNNRLSYLGGGILHSSSLAYKGQGVAFSADSGTGKSTHVGLWKQRFGDQVEIINDDKPAIYFAGDVPMLCGTPWSGKTPKNANRQVPLKAIVIVERGETNGIRRLDVVESMYHLTNQINRPFFDEELGITMLDFTERLLQSVPIYGLACNISQEAVDTVLRELFPEEE